MDIKNLARSGVNSRLTDPSPNNTDKASANNAKPAGQQSADKVTLSSLKDVSALEQKAKSTPVDNSARIAELKQQIQDGSYTVNSGQVASKLIETETLLNGNA